MVIAVKKVIPAKPVQEQVQQPKPAPQKSKLVLPVADVLTQVQTPDSSIIVKVDLMVGLKDELDAMKPKAKSFDEAKKFLQSIADSDGLADQPVEIMGSHGNKVVYSAKCDQKLIIDKGGLLAALKAKFVEAAGGDQKKGYEALLEIVSLPVGDLSTYLTEPELEPFVSKTKATGPRTLKAVLKGQE